MSVVARRVGDERRSQAAPSRGTAFQTWDVTSVTVPKRYRLYSRLTNKNREAASNTLYSPLPLSPAFLSTPRSVLDTLYDKVI